MKRENRFNVIVDKSIGFGFVIGTPHKCTGWKFCFSIDVLCFFFWFYFGKIK